jgi:tripartite-type tricarboxylate transporter receptor subunit TctC
MAPNGLPKDIAETLEKAVLEASQAPDVKTQFAPLGIDAIPHNRADFTAYIRAEGDKWTKVIQTNGLKLN